MKKIFYQNRKLLIFAIIPLLFMIIASLIKLPYDVVSPAYINEVDKVIEIDNNYQEKGSFNTVSVYSYERVSLLHYIIALFDKESTITKTYQAYNLSNALAYQAGSIQKQVSINNAIIASYSLASSYGYDVSIEYHYEGFIVDTYYTYLTPDTLKIGDIITKIGNTMLTTGNSISNLILNEEKNNPDGIEVTVKRGNKTFSYTITRNEYINYYGYKSSGYGFSGYDYYVIDSSKPTYSLKESTTIGPSGGLLQALMVFNALTSNFDISLNKKIVGTGTIDNNGIVGEIGGIYQKIITANLYRADVFFVPVYRQNGFTEEYITISKDNTWKIGQYDTNITASTQNIPYLNKDNYWCIGETITNYNYYGRIITIPNENNLDYESNFLEAYRSYKNLRNPQMAFVPVSTLEEAIVYLGADTNFETIIAQKRTAYELFKRNNQNLSMDDWISSIKEA